MNLIVLIAIYVTVFNRIANYFFSNSLFNLVLSILASFLFVCYLSGNVRGIHSSANEFCFAMVAFLLLAFLKSFHLFFFDSRAGSSLVRVALMPFFIIAPFHFIKHHSTPLRALISCGIFVLPLAFVGIVQSTFFSVLPEWFLNYKILEERFDYYLFGDQLLYRANGWFGNPLEYSVLLTMVAATIAFYNNSKYKILLLMICSAAVLCTLSRAAILGLILIFIMYGFCTRKLTKILIVAAFPMFLLSTFAYASGFDQLSALINRITTESSESESSTLTRFEYANIALNKVSTFPEVLIGGDLGVYTASNETIDTDIQDGYFFDLLADFGPFLLTIFIVAHLILFRAGLKLSKIKSTRADGFFILTAFLLWFFYGFVNSAMLHPGLIVLFYVSIGCSLLHSRPSSQSTSLG